jgi:hypothetical protein
MTQPATPEPSGDHLQSKPSKVKKPFWANKTTNTLQKNTDGGKRERRDNERISANQFV